MDCTALMGMPKTTMYEDGLLSPLKRNVGPAGDTCKLQPETITQLVQ